MSKMHSFHWYGKDSTLLITRESSREDLLKVVFAMAEQLYGETKNYNAEHREYIDDFLQGKYSGKYPGKYSDD